MSYASLAFAGFVALALVLYYIVPARFRYIILLIFSYVFYVMACNKYVIYIIVTTVSTYFIARLMERSDVSLKAALSKEGIEKEEKKALKKQNKSYKKTLLTFALIFNFGILAVLKYGDFVIANINLVKLNVFHSTSFLGFINPVLPLGISFYTFQSMGYLIDLYYGKYECEKNFLKTALYVSYFPQIIQGPISRFNDLSKTLFSGASFDSLNMKYGLYRIFWGLFKKLVVADRVAVYVTNTIDRYQELRGVYLLIAVFFYSMQIYGDFSGGIDITIGVSQLFGVKVTENFDRPFFSKSVSEYWNRWHMTLGTWFRDYIFYPITVSKSMIDLGKKCRKLLGEALGKRVPIYIAMFTVWFTTGLWHGAQWRYIIWGLLNFVIILISTECEGLFGRINGFLKWEGTFIQRLFRVVRTFLIMSFLRVFDLSSVGISQALFVIRKSLTDISLPAMDMMTELGLDEKELKAAVIGIVIMFVFDLVQRKGPVTDRVMKAPLPVRWSLTAALVIAVVIFGSYGPGYDSRAFIYLQF